VTPISLGIFASANTTVPTSYESIATVTVGSGGAANIEFTSIPSTYTHLQVRCIAKTTSSGSADEWLEMQLNGGTTAVGRRHSLYGSGSSASAESGTNPWWALSIQNDPTNVFSSAILDILDYANTNKYKTSRILWGYDNNGSGYVGMNSTLWESTSAITSIKLSGRFGNLKQYSHFALYGIKSA
jgi:hypothetical protein